MYKRIAPVILIGLGLATGCAGPEIPLAMPVPSPMSTQALPPPLPCDTNQGSCYAPPVMSTWQWQLSCDTQGTCTNLAVDVDWYDIDWEDNPASAVQAIHDAGAHAACYISVGSWEDWRGDMDAFPPEVIGRDYEGWEGEKWLDVRCVDILLPIMEARMDMCKDKGFDGVQFDNVDGWQNDTGFPHTREDYVYYSALLANLAHSKGLSVGWENAAENVPDLLPYFDWFIMEECHEWDECGAGMPMIEAGKFVGEVEYEEEYRDLEFCALDDQLRISGMFKNLDLDSFMLSCW
jgi:hypothetical protein